MSKLRIVTTKTTNLTHLRALDEPNTSAWVGPSRTVCGRTVFGHIGTHESGKFGGKGDCVRCTTQGRARGILPPLSVAAVPTGATTVPEPTITVPASLLRDLRIDVLLAYMEVESPLPGPQVSQLAARLRDHYKALRELTPPRGAEPDDDGPDPADREPTPDQERAWDLREDDVRGHAL